MYNTTAYKNVATGQTDSGNYCTYVLMDYQLHRSSQDHPGHGLYAGGSFMTVAGVSESILPLLRSKALQGSAASQPPRRSSLRCSIAHEVQRSVHGQSRFLWKDSVARGNHAYGQLLDDASSPGNYASVGLTYVYGPAITPRVPNALKFVATWTAYF